jgi:hypothetical protein
MPLLSLPKLHPGNKAAIVSPSLAAPEIVFALIISAKLVPPLLKF